MKSLFLTTTLLALTTPLLAAPTGKLSFLSPSGAHIWNLSKNTTLPVPQSQKATIFSLSPRGDGILLLPTSHKDKYQLNGYLVRPPYNKLVAVPALKNITVFAHRWSRTGNSLYLSSYGSNGVFTVDSGRYSKLSFYPESFDAQGLKVGYSTETEVRVRDVRTGKDRTLFSVNAPQPLFAALKRANNPKNLADLYDDYTIKGRNEPSNWDITAPILSLDGTRAYFATNAGTGRGAAGNTTFVFCAYNLKTGAMSVLSTLGVQFGRWPDLWLSPDGKRLLMVSSVHSSAVDNSNYALVIDLETQKTRELLSKMPGAKGSANLFGGAAWSPDGKYVALSAHFYNPDKYLKNPDAKWPELTSKDYATSIFDAATGTRWKTLNGTTSPSWTK